MFSVDDALTCIVRANQELFWLIDGYTTLRQENFRNLKKYAVSEHFTLSISSARSLKNVAKNVQNTETEFNG